MKLEALKIRMQGLLGTIKQIVSGMGVDVFVLLLGIVFRLRFYLENNSVWLDEAVTVVSIGSRSFKQILTRFDIFPDFAKPPIGFELIEKLSVTLLGNNEYAFRLFPLLSGIVSLLLFYIILKRICSWKVRALALALFAFSDPLIKYCGDTKPYSSDVLFSLILIWVYLKVKDSGFNWRSIFVLSFSGAIIIWISNPCIFILAGLGTTMIISLLKEKNKKNFVSLAVVFLVWLISFVLLYKVSLSHMVGEDSLKNTWGGAFGPDRILSLATIFWIKDVFGQMFVHPGGMYFPLMPFSIGFVGAVLFFAGCVKVFKEDKEILCIFLLPIVFTLFAALLGKYPFRGRVILFLAPSIITIVSASIDFSFLKNMKVSKVLTVVIVFVLIFYPFSMSLKKFFTGRGGIENNRQVLKFMQDNYLPNDFIVYNTSGQFSFWYYAKNLGYYKDLKRVFMGVNDGETMEGVLTGQFAHKLSEYNGMKYAAFRYDYNVFNSEGYYRVQIPVKGKDQIQPVFEKLPIQYDGPSKRVWVFLSRCEKELKDIILGAFRLRGRVLMEESQVGAQIYLFDMSGN